jgi:hypothetical protein
VRHGLLEPDYTHPCAAAGRRILLVHVFVQVGEALQLRRTETFKAAQGAVRLHGINCCLIEMHSLSLFGGGGSDALVLGVESMDYLGPWRGHTGSSGLSVQSSVLRVVHSVRCHL